MTSPSTMPGPGSHEEERVDELLAALAVPLPARPPVAERLAAWFLEVSRTPLRAALGTTWIFAAITVVVCWTWRVEIFLQTRSGPVVAVCGLDSMVYGYPDPVVARGCRQVEVGRFELFLPAALVVAVGLVAGSRVAWRQHVARRGGTPGELWSRLTESHWRAGLAALGAAGVAVALAALRPAPISITEGGRTVAAQCGANSYFFGYPDPVVRSACSRVYAGQAHMLIGAVVVGLIGAVAAAPAVVAALRLRFPLRSLALFGSALVLGVVALVASAPVTVIIPGHPATVASCGLDTYVAGYPDHLVQAACRAHLSGHFALFLGAGVLCLSAAAMGLIRRRADQAETSSRALSRMIRRTARSSNPVRHST
jgi:hypothetical protein